MALIVETGAGVEGANSYVTLDEIKAYATARGLTLPTGGDAVIEQWAIRAASYLDQYRNQFRGEKVYGQGYLQWPRYNVYIDGFRIADNVIPVELKNAQCQLCVDFPKTYVAPAASPSNGLVVKREKIDVIETEYFNPNEAMTSSTPEMQEVEAYITPLLRAGFGLRLVRI